MYYREKEIEDSRVPDERDEDEADMTTDTGDVGYTG
jgi:hypothetical protein